MQLFSLRSNDVGGVRRTINLTGVNVGDTIDIAVDPLEGTNLCATGAPDKSGTILYAMGQTQHTIGNAMVRASCILQLALGNIGVSGGGANIFRGHDNVQGATDVGPNPDSLPGYYGLAEGAFKHFASTWKVDFEWMKKQYAPGMMTKPGMTVSRWIDGVLEKNELIDQDSNLRGLVFWGHAPNSQSRGIDMVEAMKKLSAEAPICLPSVPSRWIAFSFPWGVISAAVLLGFLEPLLKAGLPLLQALDDAVVGLPGESAHRGVAGQREVLAGDPDDLWIDLDHINFCLWILRLDKPWKGVTATTDEEDFKRFPPGHLPPYQLFIYPNILILQVERII